MASNRSRLDKAALLRRLEPIKYEPSNKENEDDEAVEVSLGDSLLTLTGIKHEQEWQLCREVALHLLGEVPEPDDDDG